MKCVLQNYRTGAMEVQEAPEPALRPEGVLVRNAASLISPGTERSKVDVARASLLGKARLRPDLVRQVALHVRQEGLLATYRKAMARLETLVTLGYSSAGVVLETGARVNEFRPGDRVACAGEGYACHAEVVFVPRNLSVKVPEAVSLEEAAFTPLGAIALQSLRQAKVELGESVAVVGLGLVGLLVVQLAKAAGCTILAVDVKPARLDLASRIGADLAVHRWNDNVLSAAREVSRGQGLDAVIIAAATESPDPVELAGDLAREKGRVVIVGAVPIRVPRKPYYEKELDLSVSRAFGPGTYDPAFVERGHEYPVGYVRWTANRNMEAFLALVAERKIGLGPLISHRFPIERAADAYALIRDPEAEALGVLFTYGSPSDAIRGRTVTYSEERRPAQGEVVIGFIGAGRFARNTLIPAVKRQANVRLRAVATTRPVTAADVARRSGFERATTDPGEILDDPAISTVMIATRHDQHASLVMQALMRGKHVFVEKPLCLSMKELREIARVLAETDRHLMVGFNRRFSPLVQTVRDLLIRRTGPSVIHYRVNAGPLPQGHWLLDPVEGGGRLLGEACHFIDLVYYLCGYPPVRVTTEGSHKAPYDQNENFQITLRFQDESVGSITYTGAGDPAFPRERLEAFADGRTAVIDNYRSATVFRAGRRHRVWRWRQAMGYEEEIAAFVRAVGLGAPLPVRIEEILLSTLASLKAQEALATGSPQAIHLAEIWNG